MRRRWYFAPLTIAALVTGVAVSQAATSPTPVDIAFAKVQADLTTASSDMVVLGSAISASQTTTTVAATTTTVAPATTTVPPTTTTAPPNGYIASNFNTAPYVVADPSPPASTSALPSSGAFRIVCSPDHLAHADPIKFPGITGAGHLHMFFGNTLADANSTYSSLRTTGQGSCNGGPVNRSAYWVPAMFSAPGTVIMPNTIVVYYKAEGLGGNETPQTIAQVQQFPAGFAFISATQDINHHFWYCDAPPYTHVATIPSCPAGTGVYAHQDFPSCWDGVTANDETTHTAYITYADTGLAHCPAGFGTRLPEVTYVIGTVSDGNSANWFLSSDRVSTPFAANGSTLHADWFGAWDPPVQSTFMSQCIYAMKSCSGGQLAGSPAKQLTVNPAYTGPMLVTGQTP